MFQHLPASRVSRSGRITTALLLFLALTGAAFLYWRQPSEPVDPYASFKASGDWCAEHGVPESQCTLCGHGDAHAGHDHSGHDHGSHKDPEDENMSYEPIEALSSMDLRASRSPEMDCELNGRTITIEATSASRIRAVPVLRNTVAYRVPCTVRLEYNGNRLAHLTPRVNGVVREVLSDVGREVEEGAALLILESPELGTAKAGYLQSMALVDLWERNHRREQDLLKGGVSTEKEALETQTRLAEARIQLAESRQRLLNMGLTEDVLASMSDKKDNGNLLTLRAPFKGTLVDRHAVVGEMAQVGDTLFTLVDLSTIWAVLDVSDPRSFGSLAVGQNVRFTLGGLEGQPLSGTLQWISPSVDETTRTLRARLELANPGTRHKAHQFGSGYVEVKEREIKAVIPKESVQWDGCCNVVFVQESPEVWRVQKVRLGADLDDTVVVLEGLNGGEIVAVEGSHLLKTQLLASKIGAGCCEH
ncbi:MAG: efflux RND transporter periplasmic adaptor subunit [Planctomycetota bacterium]